MSPDLPSDDPVRALMQVLRGRWVMSLALPDPEAPAPGCTPLFFALAEPHTIGAHGAPLLIFASSPDSRHAQLTGTGPTPAGAATYLESEEIGQLRGAQLRGLVYRADRCTPAARAQLSARYLARHPVASDVLAAGRHQLYALLVTWAKVTDNRLGFGAHPLAEFDGRWSQAP